MTGGRLSGLAVGLSLLALAVAWGDEGRAADGIISIPEAAQRVVAFEAGTITRLVFGGVSWLRSFEQPWPVYLFHDDQPRQKRRFWRIDPRSGLVVSYADAAVAAEAFAEDQPSAPGGTALGASHAAAIEFLAAHHRFFRPSDYTVSQGGGRPFDPTTPGTRELGWVVFWFRKSLPRYQGAAGAFQSVLLVHVAVRSARVFGCSVKPPLELPAGETKLPPAETAAAAALGRFRTPDVAYAKVVMTSPAWYEAVNSGTVQLVWDCLVEYRPAAWYRPDDRPRRRHTYVNVSHVLVDATGQVVHREEWPRYEAKEPWLVNGKMVAAFHAGPATSPPWSVAIGKHSGLLLDRSPLVVEDEPYVPWGYAWLMGVRIYEADGGFALTAQKTVRTVALEREGGRYLRLSDLATAADAQVSWQPESRALGIEVDYRRPGLDGLEITAPPVG